MEKERMRKEKVRLKIIEWNEKGKKMVKHKLGKMIKNDRARGQKKRSLHISKQTKRFDLKCVRICRTKILLKNGGKKEENTQKHFKEIDMVAYRM